MAKIRNDFKQKAFQIDTASAFFRNNAIPFDATSIWYSLEEAKTYAQTGSTSYVGQILAVVDNGGDQTETKAYIIVDEAGTLVPLQSGDVDFTEIWEAIAALNGAMILRGFLATAEGVTNVVGSSDSKFGDTYRLSADFDGTLNGESVHFKQGDLVVCYNKDGNKSWAYVPAGDEIYEPIPVESVSNMCRYFDDYEIVEENGRKVVKVKAASAGKVPEV